MLLLGEMNYSFTHEACAVTCIMIFLLVGENTLLLCESLMSSRHDFSSEAANDITSCDAVDVKVLRLYSAFLCTFYIKNKLEKMIGKMRMYDPGSKIIPSYVIIIITYSITVTSGGTLIRATSSLILGKMTF